jgi:methionine sulfoxide reductase heme-binding subunit
MRIFEMSAPATVVPGRRGIPWKDAVRPAIYAAGAGLAAWIFYQSVTGRLGADPVRGLEHACGLWALRFLIAGLAVTPLRRAGGPRLLAYRRAIGLLAFFFAALHVAAYALLDQGGDLAVIAKDILKRPYITAGMLAFIILVPLAVSSNNAMFRRLGAARWQRLHRLVYAAAALAVLHFLMSLKAWQTEPLVYAAIVAALLLFRAGSPLRRAWRRQHTASRAY